LAPVALPAVGRIRAGGGEELLKNTRLERLAEQGGKPASGRKVKNHGPLTNQVVSLLGQEGLFFVLTYIPDLQVTTRYRAV